VEGVWSEEIAGPVQLWRSTTDTVAVFSARTGVQPMKETFPLELASEAYDDDRQGAFSSGAPNRSLAGHGATDRPVAPFGVTRRD
jgi:hypothetical protein